MTLRNVIEESCGWNKRIWADAVEYAINQCEFDNSCLKVLEIGASKKSSLSSIFLYNQHETTCSYYTSKCKEQIINGNLLHVINKYNLTLPKLMQLDAWNFYDQKYDIIILKSVIGGICRNNDYSMISKLIKHLYNNLESKGVLITIDNQENRAANLMRRYFGAGANNWTYINKDKFAETLCDYTFKQKGFGLLNFAKFPELVYSKEIINDFLYNVDKWLLKILSIHNNAVLSTIVFKD